MRLECLVLIIACLCAGLSRCLAAEPESQVPLQRNPADDGTAQRNRDGNPGHQVVPPPQIQPSPQDQQQQKHPQASDGKARDVGHSAAADSQSQTPVVPDGSHGDTAKEVEAVGSFQDVGNTGQSAGADSVLTQKEEEAAPKSVDVQPPSEGEKAVDVQEDNVNKEITLQSKEDGSATHAPYNAGGEQNVQEHLVETPAPVTLDVKTPHFPDAVLPDVKVNPEEKLATESARVPEESQTQPPSDQLSEEALPLQTPPTGNEPPQVDTKQPASQLGELPLKADDSQFFALGSGGMMVDDNPDLTLPAETPEEGSEVKELASDFQTFGEWRKKVLEEELERENEKVKKMAKDANSGDVQMVPAVSSQKLRVNYASEKCGAKIVAFNPEMENGNHMLTSNKDEYMINPCSAKKWFVVELCEPISVKTVELASLELFSSHPRSFRLSLADRFPTKEWLMGGTFEMTADKVPQPFSLIINSPYIKFVRMEMLDHYGNEHFCPVTLFRVFGLPMEDEEGDDDGVQQHTESEEEDGSESSETLFARTKATVVNLVKKVLYTDEGTEQDDGVGEAGKEKHANASGGVALPCDPDIENKRLPEKAIEGTPVTVVQPKPTIDSMQESPASTTPGEVPMVTKLDDGEQLEIEEKARNAAAGGQDLVILLESGPSGGWDRALRLCDPLASVAGPLCSISPLCQYVETMLGAPPPISRPRLTLVESPSVASTLESLVVSTAGDLEPSFTSSVQTLEILSHTEVKGTMSNNVHVQSSAESTRELTSVSSSEATTQIPDQTPTESVSSTGSAVPTEQEKSSEVVTATEKDTKTVDLASATGTAASVMSSVPVKEKPVVQGTNRKVVETDPGTAAPSATGVSSDDLTTTQPADSDVDVVQNEAEATEDKVPVDAATELLEPSIQLEKMSVVSPTLTRPTPVLEMAGASAGGGGSKGEVPETVMPCLSPSPTSETADAAEGQLDSAAFPQIIQPTVEDTQPLPQSDAPTSAPGTVSTGENTPAPKQEEVTAVQNATGASAKQNDTEKKGVDIDLVRVPLSLSAKRETAIMRLTNRIKALEINVSLSSRFLEELSARFKKQNEETMKMLNKTMNRLNTTATASQRQAALQEMRIDLLETRLDNLTQVVQTLADKFDTFAEQMSERQMTFTTLNLLLVVVALCLCYRSCQSKPLHPDLQFLLDTMPRRPPPTSAFPRRNSDVALPVHLDPDLAVGAVMKKGCSVANLGTATPSDGRWLHLDDRPEMGPKKKKRKKNKPHKAGSVDTESIGGTDSDPGLRLSSMDSVNSLDCGTEKLGHRRCGSATASFPSIVEGRSMTQSAKPDSGKDVQFLLGGKMLPAKSKEPVSKASSASDGFSPPVSLPYMMPSQSSCFAPSINAKPPLPRSQRSNSLTIAPPSAQQMGGKPVDTFDGGGRGGASVSSKAEHFSSSWEQIGPSPASASLQGVRDNHNDTDTTTSRFAFWSKPKKPVPVASSAFVNGEKETKGGNSEHSSVLLRKGSFRGVGGSEEGKGGGGKPKGSRKPWRGHIFEKA